LSWDGSKNWVNGVHLGVKLNRNRYNKFRTGRTREMINVIRRLM